MNTIITEKTQNQTYSYGCVMAYFSINKLIEDAKNIILEDDLYNDDQNSYGLEIEPHTTILYGLHDTIQDDEILSLLKMIKTFLVEFVTVSLFENELYDVLKFDVNSKELFILNKIFTSLFPFTSNFPDYHPHCTIAYLKPGKGKEYIDKFTNYLRTYETLLFVYSKANGDKLLVDVTKNETSLIATNIEQILNIFKAKQTELPNLLKEAFIGDDFEILSPLDKSINEFLQTPNIPLHLLKKTNKIDISEKILETFKIKSTVSPLTVESLLNNKFMFTIEKKNDEVDKYNENKYSHYLTFTKEQTLLDLLNFLNNLV